MADLIDAGGKCPNCGEEYNFEGGFVTIDEDTAWQTVNCFECGCVYNEVYRYSGTVVLEDGDPAMAKEERA